MYTTLFFDGGTDIRAFQYNDDEALICAMASIAVSSPPTPVPTITTPGKGGKHYVVSVGRRTGVFDNWFVPSLILLAL
jgi:hypothetical protein